jgi:18S rRNA (adenine1779-N6/adenine1780-N6)-dimethyltransferase
MFQREFAMRLVARPDSDLYCRLSANTQLLARVDHLLKVSKSNFKPPPKVESSVVRIEPRNPVPDINFLEWDGLLRVCFTRKNKTLAAIFKQKSIIQMLEQNYKTVREAKGVTEEDPEQFKEKVLRILEENNLSSLRATKMDCDDFMRALSIFASNGIHFN